MRLMRVTVMQRPACCIEQSRIPQFGFLVYASAFFMVERLLKMLITGVFVAQGMCGFCSQQMQ